MSCGIHYVTPDGRVIPFCTYNSFYREEIERRFAQPIEADNSLIMPLAVPTEHPKVPVPMNN